MRKHIAAVISMAVIAVIFNSGCSSKTIEFGHYEQDNNTSNGKEPITWIILGKNSKGQSLVISEKVLDVKQFNTSAMPITWENSTIRSWLNGYNASYNSAGKDYTSDNFIDTAFTAAEKAKIVEVTIPAHKNPVYHTTPGNDTTDKIFLLSIVEAENYFTNNENRQTDATRYAVRQGAFVYGSESTERTSDNSCTDTYCYSQWWLRSPGNDADYVATITDKGEILYGNGSLINSNGDKVDCQNFGIRPAFWIQY